MSIAEWFTRRVTYPVHERLRGRATLAELRKLERLADLTPDELRGVANERLRSLLTFAQRELPHYAEQFGRFGVDPSAADCGAELARLPVLDKPTIRANAVRMVHRAVPGGLIPHVTGGTSGDTLHFFIDRVRQSQDRAARLFMQRRFGVEAGDRRAYLWASPIELKRSRVRYWRDELMQERLLDAFDMSPARMSAYVENLIHFRPRLIYGYTSAVTLLAQHIQRHHPAARFRGLKLVVMTGDEVYPDGAAEVAAVFGAPVAAEYGAREIGLIAHECPSRGLHVFSPHVCVETVRGDARLPPGARGLLVCTTLNTRAQPLIRYRLGDVGTQVPGACRCGLPFPLLRLGGARITGFVTLPNGRLCHGALLSYMVRAEPCVRQFRVLQPTVREFEVLLMVDETFEPAALARIRQRFRENFGEGLDVRVRCVDDLPPDPSGKRRFVISEVAPRVNEFLTLAGD